MMVETLQHRPSHLIQADATVVFPKPEYKLVLAAERGLYQFVSQHNVEQGLMPNEPQQVIDFPELAVEHGAFEANTIVQKFVQS